jgi:hypothetical protein
MMGGAWRSRRRSSLTPASTCLTWLLSSKERKFCSTYSMGGWKHVEHAGLLPVECLARSWVIHSPKVEISTQGHFLPRAKGRRPVSSLCYHFVYVLYTTYYQATTPASLLPNSVN